ncbi:MAG: hypothetical protein IJ489_11680 [Clostridia bacterium]|nr:hypothetical protein [Clostridia bacterium]
MNDFASSIILTKRTLQNDVQNHFRLIRTLDGFRNTDIFSVFLTTESPVVFEEEFVFDISRDPETANTFFRLISEGNVTALTLREIAEDFIASHS